MDATVIEDLSLALAEVSAELPFEGNFFTVSARRAAAFKIQFLSFGLASDESVTELLTKVIERAPDLGFCGDLLVWSDPEVRHIADRGRPSADLEQLRQALPEKIARRLGEGEQLFQERPVYPQEPLAAALFQASTDDRIQRAILAELEENPRYLPQLLSLATQVRTSPLPRQVESETANFSSLGQRIDLETIQTMTENLPLESWSSDWEQELVVRFRQFMSTSGDDSEQS